MVQEYAVCSLDSVPIFSKTRLPDGSQALARLVVKGHGSSDGVKILCENFSQQVAVNNACTAAPAIQGIGSNRAIADGEIIAQQRTIVVHIVVPFGFDIAHPEGVCGCHSGGFVDPRLESRNGPADSIKFFIIFDGVMQGFICFWYADNDSKMAVFAREYAILEVT